MRQFSRLVTGIRQPAVLRAAPRAFSTAAPLRLKENKAQDPREIENAKQRQAHDSKAREELESQSESNVQADRENVKDHGSHIEELQKKTAQQKQNEHSQGRS